MTANPMLGVFLHWLGGLSSASFYLGYRGVKLWAWETYWLAGGVFSWILMPWLLALTLTNDLFAVSPSATAMPSDRPRYRVHGGLRHTAAADLPRRIRQTSARHPLRYGDPVRRGNLLNRYCVRRRRGNLEGTRVVRRAKARGHQRVQPEARSAGGHLLRDHERLLRIRTGGRRSHQANHAAARDAGLVARPSRTGRGSGWRFHHELHLVHDPEHPQ